MANLYHYVEQTANTDSSRLKFFGYAKLIDQVYVTYSDFITRRRRGTKIVIPPP